MVLVVIFMALFVAAGGVPCADKDNVALHLTTQFGINLASFVNNSRQDGCETGNEDELCPEPLVICPTSSCCMGGGRCGCWNARWRVCQDIPSYRVKISTCSEDGLRILGEYQIGAIANIEGGLSPELCNRPAEASIETGADGELGIRMTTTTCSRDPGGFTVLLGYSLRIEDPDGFLVEKFLFRILQNVNIGQLMAEFTRYGEIPEGDETTSKLEKFLGSYNFAWTRSKEFYWGCEQHNPLIRVDPTFLPALATLQKEEKVSESLHSQWEDCTDDGILGKTSVSTNFLSATENLCKSSPALVDLKMHAHMEWSLNITLSECLLPTLPYFAPPARLTASLTLSEAAFYKRFIKAAKTHVYKKIDTWKLS